MDTSPTSPEIPIDYGKIVKNIVDDLAEKFPVKISMNELELNFYVRSQRPKDDEVLERCLHHLGEIPLNSPENSSALLEAVKDVRGQVGAALYLQCQRGAVYIGIPVKHWETTGFPEHSKKIDLFARLVYFSHQVEKVMRAHIGS